MSTVVIVSGGLDSVTLAHVLFAQGETIRRLVSFDYGQRHSKELDYAQRCARSLNTEWSCVDLRSLKSLLRGSALTDDIPVPLGHYADETMRQTVVPNRNAIMLSIAVGAAVADGASRVSTAVHAGDHPIYPDCRPEFIAAFDAMSRKATEGFSVDGFSVVAPFMNLTKADIVTIGAEINVPFQETWSCYQGGAAHCGKCGTCVERREAFALAGVVDPTEYECDV